MKLGLIETLNDLKKFLLITFSLLYSFNSAADPDYGVNLNSKGASFKVWAPNAQAVCVIGEFNDWSVWSHPLSPSSNGSWSTFVTGAKAGDLYKYVIANNGSLHYRKDPYSQAVTSSIGDSVIIGSDSYTWNTNEWTRPSWNELVIYEMHVGTYASQDNNENVATFDDAIGRLNHLKTLGVNCIELMPVAEFPGDRSWGYNPSNPFSVESSYGGSTGLKRFVDAAHERGIAVLLDVVWNHLGPTDLDLWKFDGSDKDNIYFYNDYRSSTPWGDTRPNFSRGEVRQYIRDNFIYLLNEYRVDGFRVDGTKFIRKTDVFGEELPEGWSLLQWINNEIDLFDLSIISIAEDLDGNEWITKTTGAGGAGFNSQWDWFVHPVRSQLAQVEDSSRSMSVIRDVILSNYNGSWLDRVIYTESHDEVANGRTRFPEEIDPENPSSFYAKKRSLLGACLVFTSPGIPMVFQGQEMLEDGWFTDEDPLDWEKADTNRGIVNCYKDLIHLRRDLLNVSNGLTQPNVNVFHLNDNQKLLGFHRFGEGGEGDDVVVIMNFSSAPYTSYRIGFPRAGIWNTVLNSDSRRYDSNFNNYGSDVINTSPIYYDGLENSAEVSIAPYSFLIMSQSQLESPLDPVGACCNNDYCYFVSESVCFNYGGSFKGSEVVCLENTCELPPAPGACCVEDNCFQILEVQCVSIGGSFSEQGLSCQENICITSCTSDLTEDSVVNVLDLLLVVSNFGLSNSTYDVNSDNIINTLDLLEVISSFGTCE